VVAEFAPYLVKQNLRGHLSFEASQLGLEDLEMIVVSTVALVLYNLAVKG